MDEHARMDGSSRGHAISFVHCASGDIEFDRNKAHRIPFDVTDTAFQGRGGLKLAGRLVLPKGNDPVPIVVLIHGAEHDSARNSYALQRLLPANNVGAFVYDKRGTGGSEGKYTQDFDTLADDAVSAVREVKRIAGARCVRIGYQGGSQGGWIAPLAATRAPVDFVIVTFGLAVSVIDEDQEEVALEMQLKGHTREEISKALEVASAASSASTLALLESEVATLVSRSCVLMTFLAKRSSARFSFKSACICVALSFARFALACASAT